METFKMIRLLLQARTLI